MASITLGTFRDYLKALNDWVNGLKEPKVQLSGSSVPDSQPVPIARIRRYEVQTILNAVSVPAGGVTATTSTNWKGEDMQLIAVNIDQQPWTAEAVTMFGGGPVAGALWPKFENVTSTHPNVLVPAVSIYVGTGSTRLLQDPTSILEAVAIAAGFPAMAVRVRNNSAAVATVTVRVVRIWR